MKTPDSAFWNRIAKRYARKPVANEAAYHKKLEQTREHLRSDMDVLEFGCGTGSTAILHAPFVKHILAIDISSNMLHIARSKAAEQGIENITFEEASIETLNAADQSYDVVLGMSILHLVADKEAVIAKVHDVLKPGGLFITSTTCLGDAMAWIKWIEPVGRRVGLMPALNIFTAKELMAALTDRGFDIIEQWQPSSNEAVFMVAKKREV